MANSISNNDDITFANGVRNPMEKNLNCNEYNVDDVGKLTCNELEIDTTLDIGGALSIGGVCNASNFNVAIGGIFYGDATSACNVGSVQTDTTIVAGTNCNVGENLAFILQGGGPTYNLAGAYAVNNVPALEMYFQSIQAGAGQYGVATLRSSNGALNGIINRVVVDESEGIALFADSGNIILDATAGDDITLNSVDIILNATTDITLNATGDINLDAPNVNGLQSQDIMKHTRIINTDTNILKDVNMKNEFLLFEGLGSHPTLHLDVQIENGLVVDCLLNTDATGTITIVAINGVGSVITNKFTGLLTANDITTMSGGTIDSYTLGNSTLAHMRFTSYDNGIGIVNEWLVEILGYSGSFTINT